MKIKPFDCVSKEHYDLLLSADPDRRMVDSYLARAEKFEAVIDDQLVGLIVLIDTHPRTLEIVNLAVKEAFQNQGIAQRLLEFAETWAKDQQVRTLEIATGTTSFAQLYLYQKMGIRVISVERDFFTRNYQAPIIENKLLLKDLLRLNKRIFG
ncbi:GNAT family N-acetyltransferase [Xylocopilactobacillus apicola]|uniref:N-acetyltransferase YvbK n=1 Tax=Xylocopilactobacillus apicola TaxID=2932184 RepID=A0AAU9DAD6_9LACO|nr:GNAT family N-acetyltransferase [Xylocopilactobacillus apicola]BDR59396.1 putative N-acetyltransferase YvbK [Xylocopilactobacillus apicola]